MGLGKPVFTRKTYGVELYKWSPESSVVPKHRLTPDNKPFYCNAVSYSNGEDWVTTYSYELSVVNSKVERIAYVACDYVV